MGLDVLDDIRCPRFGVNILMSGFALMPRLCSDFANKDRVLDYCWSYVDIPVLLSRVDVSGIHDSVSTTVCQRTPGDDST